MKNFINDIEIKNFKSIKHQKIDGCKRINVFIGYPNVGKSNILEALSCASIFQFINAGFSEISLKDLIRLESYTDLFYEGNISERVTVKLDSERISFKFYKPSETIYCDISIGTIRKNVSDIVNLKFYKNLNITEDSLIEVKQSLSIINDKPNFIKNVLKYSFLERDLGETTHLDNKASLLPYGQNLMHILSGNPELRKTVSQLFEIYGLKLVLDKGSQSIKIMKENKDGTILLLPYSLIADTLQRLIFYQTAIHSNNNSILLFEEPEAHMFPPYISKFTGDIIYNKKNNNQYFITTHSPFVISDFLEDAKDDLSLYVVGYKNGETVIKRLTDEQLHEIYQYGVDIFLNIEDYLRDDR